MHNWIYDDATAHWIEKSNVYTLDQLSESDIAWLWGCNILIGILGWQIYAWMRYRRRSIPVPARINEDPVMPPVIDRKALLDALLKEADELSKHRLEAQKPRQEPAPYCLEPPSTRHAASQARE